MNRRILWLPLAIFALLFLVIGIALIRPADRAVRSALVGKQLPAFVLPPAIAGKPGALRADFDAGRPRLLNVWASWCIPCIAEAPQLMAIRQAGIPIDGVAIHDRPEAIRTFLARNGDPYARLSRDDAGVLQPAIGSTGVPETYVIDGQGRIVLQQMGAIRAEDVPAILKAVEEAS